MSFFGGDDYNHQEQEEEEDDPQDQRVEYKEHIVFLVDASESMFNVKLANRSGGSSSSFEYVRITIAEVLKQRIMANARDEIAVVFYNTVKMENTKHFGNVYVLVPRDVPDANTVRTIKALTEEKFKEDIGSMAAASGPDAPAQRCDAVKHALWVAMDCLQAATTKSSLSGVKHRVFMFSNEEDPTDGATPMYKQFILDRAATLRELGAQLRVFPLVAAVKPSFNMNRFWNQLIKTVGEPVDDETAFVPTQAGAASAGGSATSQASSQTQAVGFFTGSLAADGTAGAAAAPAGTDAVLQRLKQLGDMMKRSMAKRHASYKATLTVAQDVEIAVQIHGLLVEAKKPSAVKLRARDNELVQTDTAKVSDDTGALLGKVESKAFKAKEMKTAAPNRFPRVVLGIEEVQSIKACCQPPGLVLLGFKPRHCLKDYHNVTHSHFLRPNDRAVAGSTTLFKALLDAMITRNVVGLCRYVRTRRAQPQLVALLPQPELCDEYGNLVWPEGMHLIRLPWKDDIRSPETDPNVVGTSQFARADPEQVAAAAALLGALELDFELAQTPNPVLDKHSKALQALALGEEEEEAAAAFEDETEPDLAGIDARGAVGAFGDAVGLMGAAGGGGGGGGAKPSAGTKRKAAADEGLSTAEKYALHDWPTLAREGKLNKLTAEVLKVYLRHHQLGVSGVKADLIDRIKSHLGM